MITLRPYQQEALNAILATCLEEQFLLLQAATGAGKTILFSALVKHLMAAYRMRVGIVAHREILVRQAYDKLIKVWPEGWHQVGLACASVTSRVDLERAVVIGSPQTLSNRMGDMPPLDLLIIDEAHRLPPRNHPSQYKTLISRLLGYQPTMRVLGVTATPFRLGHGYVYGQRCKPGTTNWFSSLVHQVSIADLIAQDYLVPYHALEAGEPDLSGVDKSKGEFSLDQLGDLMARKVHIRSAVEAYRRWGEDRRHVVAFCVTIKHAEALTAAFAQGGYAMGLVHSQMPSAERRATLEAFEAGALRMVANVGVLTEGWDSTAVDCLLLCRPTMSPALYVQIVGRGLRTHPGKADCLILDLSGNCRRHGDPSEPLVMVPGPTKDKEPEEPRLKACPACAHFVPPPSRSCPYCGYAWPEEALVDAGIPQDMRAPAWAPKQVHVERWSLYQHRSLRGHMMLRLEVECYNGGRVPIMVNHYLDLEGNSGLYARSKARDLWLRLAGTPPPTNEEDALRRQGELRVPQELLVQQKGKYWNVTRWN